MNNKIICNCKICGITYEIHNDIACQECYMKEFDRLMSIKVNKNKKSIWNRLKEFSYMGLLTMPLFFTTNLIYGLKVQLIVICTFILGQCAGDIIKWLMRKF